MSGADTLGTGFAGRRGAVMRLVLRTSLLTLFTLGLYRFWMTTRLRRYYWSAVKPGGLPLEYVGEPLEKLLGFLIAVVFLAFYLGIVNLLLMFGSFAFFEGVTPAYLLSFIGILPILFAARYRARRYILARTRWRGIRFGQMPGAWGYAGRALLHWGLTILTLGLWWPRMTFALEKYRTDRTTFGNVRLTQGGGWRMLYPPFLHLPAATLASVAVIYVAAAEQSRALVFFPITAPWFLFALVNYRVQATRLMAEHKTAPDLALGAAPRTWRVIRHLSVGILAMIGLLAVLGGGMGAVLAAATLGAPDPAFLTSGLQLGLGVAVYAVFFVLGGALWHGLVTLPIRHHYAETLTIRGADAVPRIAQADRDEMRQAEGFAEALDVGAAI